MFTHGYVTVLGALAALGALMGLLFPDQFTLDALLAWLPL